MLFFLPKLKMISSFLFSIDFFYIYKYYRKFNAEFNTLIQTVGHYARFFEKWCWTHLCQQFWLYLNIFIFSPIKSLSCYKTLKRDFEPKILIKGVHLTNFEISYTIESW